MILSSRTQFSGDRTRLRTERPVRAVNTAYGRVFTIIRQRPSQKPSDRRTGHMAYLCPNFAELVHPTHHGQPTPRACHCNNTEQRAITMRSVLVVQAELFTIIRPLLAIDTRTRTSTRFCSPKPCNSTRMVTACTVILTRTMSVLDIPHQYRYSYLYRTDGLPKPSNLIDIAINPLIQRAISPRI